MVEDTGAGLAPDEIKTAFEPFGRVENAYSRSHEGTGLGLSICYGIMELHGGEIEVESAPGRGTAVSLIFPVKK